MVRSVLEEIVKLKNFDENKLLHISCDILSEIRDPRSLTSLITSHIVG